MAVRFIKSSTHIRRFIASQTRVIVRDCYESIEKVAQHQNPSIVRYPALEAIIDAFRSLYEETVEFRTVQEPTLHKVMPNLQQCVMEMSRIEHGEVVIREGDTMVRPSLYSMRFSVILKEKVKNIEVHDLWLVACFLHPLLRDMKFWMNDAERAEFQIRAETLARSMCLKLNDRNFQPDDEYPALHHIHQKAVPRSSIIRQETQKVITNESHNIFRK